MLSMMGLLGLISVSLQVQKVILAIRGLKVPRELRELSVPLEQQGAQALKVTWVLLVLQEQLDLKEFKAIQVLKVFKVPLGSQALKELQDLLGLLVVPVLKGTRVLLDQQVQQAHKVCRVIQDQPDRKATLELLDQQALKASRVPLETRAQQDLLGPQDCKVILGRPEVPDLKAPPGQQAL